MAKTRELRKFKLKDNVGPHFEPNPEFDPELPEEEGNIRHNEYAPGEIVKSSRPLDKLFVNKFIPMDSVGDRSKIQSPGGDVADPDEDPDAERPVRDVEAARVRAPDRHAEPDELEGKSELQKLAKGKKIEASEDDDDEDEEESSEAEKEEVTDEFDGAKEGGLQVFKSGDKYHIHEEGEEEPMEGAKRGFGKKSEVKTFIKKQVKT